MNFAFFLLFFRYHFRIDDFENSTAALTNRAKRESSVEYRSCNQLEAQFQLEIVEFSIEHHIF